MAEKCQIIPKTVFASCETYNCLKPVAWAIGRPDGPIQKMVFFCDQCMRDMVGSIPEELRPEPEPDLSALQAGLVDTPGEYVAEVVEPEQTDIPQPPKVYACKYCGEVFNTPTKVGSHTRYCQAKKEAKPENEEKEG